MLYLFGSGAWEGDRKVIKIGYTDDIDRRMKDYKFLNPLGKLIDSREGDKLLEAKLHIRLYDHRVEFLEEWFYDESEVVEVFKMSTESIDNWLWENRDNCLIYPTIPKPGTLKRSILDELMKKYNSGKVEGEKNL